MRGYKNLRKYVKEYVGPESQKDRFDTCRKIRKSCAAEEETAACHASESAKSVIL